MNYYLQVSEVCIWWTLNYPMRPWERICQCQWSDATDVGRSHVNNNMVDIVCPHYIHTIYNILFLATTRTTYSESMWFWTQPLSIVKTLTEQFKATCMLTA